MLREPAARDRAAVIEPLASQWCATQTANDRSMRLAARVGFIEVERFEAYRAEQWFGMWGLGLK